MAKSKFEYVKAFEVHHSLLPETWMVVRIDGHSFHRFTAEHNFAKPNDLRALLLANHAAEKVMEEFKDILMAYGQSDEYSFVIRRNSQLYKRREAKITSTLVSLFTSCYVVGWPKFFPDLQLKYPPSFDSRIVVYPTHKTVRDYLSWRQADCHINNLYNTCFWALVQNDGKTEEEAQRILKDTDSAAKNEMLFTKFNLNYNNLNPMFRKGSILFRKEADVTKTAADGTEVTRKRKVITLEHCDIIGETFWDMYPGYLDS